jgi:hypothetical protein
MSLEKKIKHKTKANRGFDILNGSKFQDVTCGIYACDTKTEASL